MVVLNKTDTAVLELAQRAVSFAGDAIHSARRNSAAALAGDVEDLIAKAQNTLAVLQAEKQAHEDQLAIERMAGEGGCSGR